jgi:RNAse (barnase) inhibitor barstar
MISPESSDDVLQEKYVEAVKCAMLAEDNAAKHFTIYTPNLRITDDHVANIKALQDCITKLVECADSLGYTVTVTQEPKQPLAQSHYKHVVTVYNRNWKTQCEPA